MLKLAEHNDFELKTNIDSLTGLITLKHFLELGNAMLEKGCDVTVLVIDINYFKYINEAFGYLVGNSVLVDVSNYLKQIMERFDNVIARLGGDEFILAVKNYSEENQEKLSNLISALLNNTTFYTDRDLKPLKLSFSIGEANSKYFQNATIEDILNSADKNMYFKKLSNNNTISFDYHNAFDIPEIYQNFLKVLAEKDMYTYVHSLFSAKNAANLAEKLNLPIAQTRDIYIAGLLHDIGKILLPNYILKKPTKLTNEQYEQVKLHVNFSLCVLKDTNISFITLNAIRCHHFRWDGSGYPRDTKGKDIPLEGRILAIADAYTAMTIKRLYRNSLSIDEAIQELIENRGTQFDPYLVDIFVEILTEKHYYHGDDGAKQ